MPLILSIFPGVDLLGRAFEEVWPEACLVRGPDLVWGGDIRTFHPPSGVFNGVIGGPPCQAFSRLRLLVAHQGNRIAENLIPEFARIAGEAGPAWFLMENVCEAPTPAVVGYAVDRVECSDHWCGGETRRRRAFSFGTREGRRLVLDLPALHRPDPEPPVLASGGTPRGVRRTAAKIRQRMGVATSGYKTRRYYVEALQNQGLPVDFLARAPFTVAGKIKLVGNGVPLAMGRAVALAVRRAVE